MENCVIYLVDSLWCEEEHIFPLRCIATAKIEPPFSKQKFSSMAEELFVSLGWYIQICLIVKYPVGEIVTEPRSNMQQLIEH